MTSETTDAPLSEEQMGTHLSRLAKPFLLAAPLMVVTLAPAALYGQRSRSVAADADRELVAALTPSENGRAVEIDRDMLCDSSAAGSLTTSFAELDVDGDSHKSSVTGLGFDTVTVDVKGWVDGPSGPDRDDIMIKLNRLDGGWCVADVETLVSETNESSERSWPPDRVPGLRGIPAPENT